MKYLIWLILLFLFVLFVNISQDHKINQLENEIKMLSKNLTTTEYFLQENFKTEWNKHMIFIQTLKYKED